MNQDIARELVEAGIDSDMVEGFGSRLEYTFNLDTLLAEVEKRGYDEMALVCGDGKWTFDAGKFIDDDNYDWIYGYKPTPHTDTPEDAVALALLEILQPEK